MSVSGDGLGAEIVICVKSTIRPPGIGRSINIQCHVSIPPPPRQACKVSGSSWGERAEKADEGARREFALNFYRRCGARRPERTQDIHWPMTLSIRAPVVAADGRQLRQRSPTTTRPLQRLEAALVPPPPGRSSGF